MTLKFEFTEYAFKQFKQLPIKLQNRIKSKLEFWQSQPNPLSFAKRLKNFDPATHRFRIGEYRMICCLEKDKLVILVLKIAHRNIIYKQN